MDSLSPHCTLRALHVQVVSHEGCILEKPGSESEARSFLQGYGRTSPGTVGSIVITNLGTGVKVEVRSEFQTNEFQT